MTSFIFLYREANWPESSTTLCLKGVRQVAVPVESQTNYTAFGRVTGGEVRYLQMTCSVVPVQVSGGRQSRYVIQWLLTHLLTHGMHAAVESSNKFCACMRTRRTVLLAAVTLIVASLLIWTVVFSGYDAIWSLGVLRHRLLGRSGVAGRSWG